MLRDAAKGRDDGQTFRGPHTARVQHGADIVLCHRLVPGARALGIRRESVTMIYLLGVLMLTVITGDYLSGFAVSFFSVMLLISSLRRRHIPLSFPKVRTSSPCSFSSSPP